MSVSGAGYLAASRDTILRVYGKHHPDYQLNAVAAGRRFGTCRVRHLVNQNCFRRRMAPII